MRLALWWQIFVNSWLQSKLPACISDSKKGSFSKHHFQSFIGFPIVGKSPFHAVSWHSKMCFVPLRTGLFWGFKQSINTKVPAILYLYGNLGVFCACDVRCCVPYPSVPANAWLMASEVYYSLDYLHPKSPFLPRLVESTDVSSQAENPSLSLHLHFLCYHTFVTRLKKQEPQPSKVKLLPSSIRGLRRFITCLW